MDLQKVKEMLVAYQEFEAAACVRDVQDEILKRCEAETRKNLGGLGTLRASVGDYSYVRPKEKKLAANNR